MKKKIIITAICSLALGAFFVYHCAQKNADSRELLDDNFSHLAYLGECGEIKAYYNSEDSIYFSDGKSVVLKYGTEFGFEDSLPNTIRLLHGARVFDVSIKELYNAKEEKATNSDNVYYHKKDYNLNSSDGRYGFFVDMEIPKGNSASDKAFRAWMMKEATRDIFGLFGDDVNVAVMSCDTPDKIIQGLEEYHTKWNDLYQKTYEGPSALGSYVLVEVNHIAENDEYATYYYYSYIYNGGAHGGYHSYYITYDKNRDVFVSATNTINPSKQRFVEKEVKKELMIKKGFEKEEIQRCEKEDAPMPIYFAISDICNPDDAEELSKADLEDAFPLQHFAILPDGIVVSYHPCQTGAFAEGEFHVLLPFDKIKGCLMYEYKEDPSWRPRLTDILR